MVYKSNVTALRLSDTNLFYIPHKSCQSVDTIITPYGKMTVLEFFDNSHTKMAITEEWLDLYFNVEE